MKGLFAALLFLPFLLAAAQDDDACPPGFELVEENGEFRCVETEIICPGGNQRQFTDVISGAHLCCLPANQLVIYDETTRLGACCTAGEVYVGVAPNGKCCPEGQILHDGNCATPAR